jgi:UDP-glucose 4-epimerase
MPPSSTRPQRLLITGGRGRLATLVSAHFRAAQYPVELFSREAGPGFEALQRLSDPATLAGAGALLHLAWSSLPATAEQAPAGAEAADLDLLRTVLRTLSGLPPAQRPLFVFFSSGGAIYGNAPGRPSREEDPCRPLGRYGQSKLAAETLIKAAASAGLPCSILRISNPFGFTVPSSRAQGIIPHAVRCALEGQPLTVWGDGHARKDFLYYSDFLAALQLVVERRLAGCFNLAAGESHSVREIIALVEKHTGRQIATHFTPAAGWDVDDSRLDPAKFVAATGWRPQVSLEEGIRRAVESYGRS